jgi:hypothetical protein
MTRPRHRKAYVFAVRHCSMPIRALGLQGLALASRAEVDSSAEQTDSAIHHNEIHRSHQKA